MSSKWAARLATAIVVALTLGGCSWTQFGFDGSHTDFNPSEPTLTPTAVQNLTQVWSATCPAGTCVGPSFSGQAATDGTGVFVGVTESTATTSGAFVYRFDEATGKLVWKSPRIGSATRSGVALGNGRVYVITWDCPNPAHTVNVTCLVGLDAATGAGVSSVQLDPTSTSSSWGSPTVVGQSVLVSKFNMVPSFQGVEVRAYSNGTGVPVWTHPLRDELGGGPGFAVGGQTVFLTAGTAALPRLLGYRVSDGATLVDLPLDVAATHVEAVAANVVYLGGAVAEAFDVGRRVVVWEQSAGGGTCRTHGLAVGPSVTVAREQCGNSVPSLVAYDTGNGRQLWSKTADVTAPVLANGVVYAGERAFSQPPVFLPPVLIALTANAGTPLFTSAGLLNDPESGPTVADGKVFYVASNNLELRAFAPRS